MISFFSATVKFVLLFVFKSFLYNLYRFKCLQKFSTERKGSLDSVMHLMSVNFNGAKNGEQDHKYGAEHRPGEHIDQ